MTHQDTVALLKAAQKHGVPPIHFSVFHAMLGFTNWKWMCHPGQRKLADLCSINKDTVTASVKWLADHCLIRIYPKPRALSVYEILRRNHWVAVRSGRTVQKCKLSGSTAQFAVRSGRTVEFGVYTVNCPARSDINKDSTQGAVGNASHLEVVEPPAAESKVAFL